MLRSRVRPMWAGLTMLAMTIPVGIAAQGTARVRVQAPPARRAPAPTPVRSDHRLSGFLGIRLEWDGRDRDDHARWIERYRRYDDRDHRFSGRLDGWYAPRWGDSYFELDPLRFASRPLDHKDLRRLLDDRTWDRVRQGAPGGTGRLRGRVERFGPAGRATTLEIWSGDRFVAALTDFDRDGWIDDVVVNGRYWR